MPIPDEIPQGSVEFVSIVFNSTDDLTTGTVHIGLSPTPLVQPTTWLAATWVPGEGNTAETAAPVNTSGMAKGYYQVWGRLTDSPEILPRTYGVVRIV